MSLKTMLSIVLAATLFTACNSDAKKAKSEVEYVAYQVCEGAKAGSLSAMMEYVTDTERTKLEELDKLFQTSMKDPKVKKAFEALKNKMSSVDCVSSNIINEQTDGSFLVSNLQTHQMYSLRPADGSWRLVLAQ